MKRYGSILVMTDNGALSNKTTEAYAYFSGLYVCVCGGGGGGWFEDTNIICMLLRNTCSCYCCVNGSLMGRFGVLNKLPAALLGKQLVTYLQSLGMVGLLTVGMVWTIDCRYGIDYGL